MRSDPDETREIPVTPDESEFVRLIKEHSYRTYPAADKVEPQRGSDLLAWIVFWSCVFFAYVIAGLIAGHLILEVFTRLP